ncbi:MAG: DnaJ domain-containing protein [Bdellovibrionales bacterium]|nr:DnaJ domain-containing protein [Bdellovibrionales bacterium]
MSEHFSFRDILKKKMEESDPLMPSKPLCSVYSEDSIKNQKIDQIELSQGTRPDISTNSLHSLAQGHKIYNRQKQKKSNDKRASDGTTSLNWFRRQDASLNSEERKNECQSPLTRGPDSEAEFSVEISQFPLELWVDLEVFRRLGSAPSSPLTRKKLKKHYRLLAMRFHPDREGGCPETFKSLQQAYGSLSKALTAK